MPFQRRFAVYALLVLPLVFAPARVLAAVTRGPYLQMGSPDAVTVRWRTSSPTTSRVAIGLDPARLERLIDDPKSVVDHQVRVTGLAADTRYYYSISSMAAPAPPGDPAQFFETAPATGADGPIRIWAIGDSGKANTISAAVYSAYRQFTGTTYTDVWLMLGDNAYDNGLDAEYQTALFNRFPPLLRQSVLWPAVGNHDGRSSSSATQTGPYFSIFSLPKAGEAGGVPSGTEAYYSFDHGNVHFVVLDSFGSSRAPGSPMLTWLEADLQANQSDWVIASWHHPPYSRGGHRSDFEVELVQMRTNVLPILERHGVDLVLSGHSHAYERSQFIDGHYGLSTTFSSAEHVQVPGSGRIGEEGPYSKSGVGVANAGAVYVVAGAASQTSGGTLDHPAMHLSLNEAGSVVIDINELTMNVRYLGADGSVRDFFTILKGAGTDAASSIGGLVWQDSDADGIRESGESPLSLIEIRLYDVAGAPLATTRTDAAGSYRFGGLPTGDHVVQFVADGKLFSPRDAGGNDAIDSDADPQDGRTATISVADGARVGHVDAGLRPALTASTTVVLQDGLNGYAGTHDAYIASARATTAFGNDVVLLADGSDATLGRIVGLLRWELAGAIPAGAVITAATVTLQVTNPSNGRYDLVAATAPWSEATVTWGGFDVAGSGGSVVGSMTPTTTGARTLVLNGAGIATVQGWADGTLSNHGLMLIDAGTTDGVDLRSSEYGAVAERPRLSVTYQ